MSAFRLKNFPKEDWSEKLRVVAISCTDSLECVSKFRASLNSISKMKSLTRCLVDLVDENERWVVVNYKETQTAYLQEGQPVEIEVDAVPGIIFKGTVKSISRATGASFSLLPQDNSAGNSALLRRLR